MPPSSTSSTRAALLSAAESLYLDDGYDNVSVRAICAAAGANPAAVHYHFGSKERLTIELLEQRLGPLWADPLDRFDPTTDDAFTLVEVILRPFVEIQHHRYGRLHLQLLHRFAATVSESQWTQPWFQLDRWTGMLEALIPDLTPQQSARRWALAFQLILAGFGGERRLSDAAVDALTDFVVGGLTAPVHTRSANKPSAKHPIR